MSSSYHLQSDGKIEVLNKTLEMFLRCFVFDNPKSWYSMLLILCQFRKTSHIGNTLALRKTQKLNICYFGPFEGLKEIHPIFHINLLKKFIGSPSQQYIPLPLTTTGFGPLVEPLQVFGIPYHHKAITVNFSSFNSMKFLRLFICYLGGS